MKNSEYWKERFEQINESLLNKGEEYYKDLDKEYRKAMNTIELQINNWYMRIANNNKISMTEAKKWLNGKELEEFHWAVEEYIEKGKTLKYSDEWVTELENASAKVHIRRLEALEIQLKQTVEELYQRQYEELSERLKVIYEEGYYHTAFEIQKGFNVGWTIPALDSNRVEKVISKPWTSDGVNFSDRIWKAKDDLINVLHTELTQSIIMGRAPDKAIAKIAKKFNTSKARAGRLIMTESAFFASVSQKDCFNDLGVEAYKVCSTLDLRTSEVCRDMDGKVFKMSDYEPGITAPPFHCWCRTTTIPYFDDNFGERIARGSDGKSYYVPNNMTYHEWYEKYIKDGRQDIDSKVIEKKQKGSRTVNDSPKKVDVSTYISQESQTDWTKYLDIEKETSEQLNHIHSNLNKEMIEINKEKLVLLDINTNSILKQKTGDIDNVEFDKSIINVLKKSPPDSIILTHNHPSNTPFSEADIQNIIAYKSIKALTLECIDGSQYIMERGELKSGALKGYFFGDRYMSIYSEIALKYPELNDSIKIHEIWSTYIDHVNKEVARKYGMLYRKVDK